MTQFFTLMIITISVDGHGTMQSPLLYGQKSKKLDLLPGRS